jgi:hypothetical protein
MVDFLLRSEKAQVTCRSRRCRNVRRAQLSGDDDLRERVTLGRPQMRNQCGALLFLGTKRQGIDVVAGRLRLVHFDHLVEPLLGVLLSDPVATTTRAATVTASTTERESGSFCWVPPVVARRCGGLREGGRVRTRPGEGWGETRCCPRGLVTRTAPAVSRRCWGVCRRRSWLPIAGWAQSGALPSGFGPATVSATSPTDAWVITNPSSNLGNYQGSNLLHWDGSTWSQVTDPSFSASSRTNLSGVSASSPSDAWVVGSTGTPNHTISTFTSHWDGHSWTTVASPNPAGSLNDLTKVVSVSPSDAWAMGYTSDSPGGSSHDMVLHWDGQRWSVALRVRALSTVSQVKDLTADAHNVWLLQIVATRTGGYRILHYNGHKWSVAKRWLCCNLTGISARSPRSIFTVGILLPISPTSDRFHAIDWHYNGKKWLSSQNSTIRSNLFSVSADSVKDAWAAGWVISNCSGAIKTCLTQDTLIAHFNGHRWIRVPSPNPDAANQLSSISADSPTDVWAVGLTGDRFGSYTKPLVLHYNGTSWSSS